MAHAVTRVDILDGRKDGVVSSDSTQHAVDAFTLESARDRAGRARFAANDDHVRTS